MARATTPPYAALLCCARAPGGFRAPAATSSKNAPQTASAPALVHGEHSSEHPVCISDCDGERLSPAATAQQPQAAELDSSEPPRSEVQDAPAACLRHCRCAEARNVSRDWPGGCAQSSGWRHSLDRGRSGVCSCHQHGRSGRFSCVFRHRTSRRAARSLIFTRILHPQ